MLIVIQQFALERLREMGAEPEARDWHLSYFLDLAEKAEPFLTGGQRQHWLEQLQRDDDNLRAALAWSYATERGLRLVGALRWFWEYAGMVREGRAWAEKAIRACSPGDSAARAKALWSAGSMAWLQRDYPAAHVWLEESARIWHTLIEQAKTNSQDQEAKRGLARTLRKLGNVLYGEQDFSAARALKQSSVALFRNVGTSWDLALDLHLLGHILIQQGEIESARSAFKECSTLFQQEQDPWGIGVAFIDLGMIALQEGDPVSAGQQFKESLNAVLQSPSPWTISNLFLLLAVTASQQDELARAAQLFGAAEALREQSGFSIHAMHQSILENGISLARHQLGEKDFAREWANGRAMTIEHAVACALETPG